MIQPREFSSLELCELTGATKRQLQWWDERNMIRPLRASGGRPDARLYSARQALQVFVIIDLKSRGMPLNRAMDMALRASLEPKCGRCHYMLVPDDNGSPKVVDKNSIFPTIAESACAWYLVDLKPFVKAIAQV